MASKVQPPKSKSWSYPLDWVAKQNKQGRWSIESATLFSSFGRLLKKATSSHNNMRQLFSLWINSLAQRLSDFALRWVSRTWKGSSWRRNLQLKRWTKFCSLLHGLFELALLTHHEAGKRDCLWSSIRPILFLPNCERINTVGQWGQRCSRLPIHLPVALASPVQWPLTKRQSTMINVNRGAGKLCTGCNGACKPELVSLALLPSGWLLESR